MPIQRLKPGILSVVLGVLVVPALALLVVGGGYTAFRAPSAYGFQGSAVTTVTTEPGSTCQTLYSRDGGGGTDCPATWTVDGEVVHGEITSDYGGAMSLVAGSVQAHVWGDTASTSYDAGKLRWGLWGPYLLAAGLVLLPVSLAGHRWAVLRNVRGRLAKGQDVPWGPFVVRRDGLRAGTDTVPWAQVDGAVKEGSGNRKLVRVTVAGELVEVPERAVDYSGAFLQFIRRQTRAVAS